MEESKDKIHLTHFLLFAILLGVGILIGSTFFTNDVHDRAERGKDGKKYDYSAREQNNKQWQYISPLLDCTDSTAISNQQVNSLQSDVRHFIDSNTTNGVTDISVYFRDLTLGPWFGINAEENFFPASLLKVPLMMSALKQGMKNPSFLGQTFVFKGPSRNNEFFRAPQELQDGQTYTVEDAIKYMIVYSDNNASHILSMSIDEKELLDSYRYLGIATPGQNNYQISVRTYASFFRILYNSTFLDRDYSEQALKLLSQTSFSNGLVAGIPSGVTVSHKFGERQLEDGKEQLHDCGIVYAPGKPYLLCIMTRGDNFQRLETVISHISRMVYNAVTK